MSQPQAIEPQAVIDEIRNDNNTADQYPWLVHWKKGQSGNPKGRPPNRGRAIIECINDLPDNIDDEGLRKLAKQAKSLNQRKAAKLMIALGDGDRDACLDAFRLLFDYTDGKAIARLLIQREEQPTLDLRLLTEAEIETLATLLEKARGDGQSDISTNVKLLPNSVPTP